jgi:hypothetical protein
MEALEQGEKNLKYWHLQNSSNFMKNSHALTNLKKFKIKNPTSANAIKNYINGTELISPQMKSIIDQQKKFLLQKKELL